MRDIQEYTLMSGQGVKTANFTAATNDVITSNSHGLSNGDMIVFSTTGTLPGGLSSSNVYYVIEATTNTFKVTLTPVPFGVKTGDNVPTPVNITSTGSGTHSWTEHDIGRNIYVGDHRHIIVEVASANSAAMTYKFVGSNEETCPDFSAARSVANNFEYINAIDKQDGLPIDGDDGITLAGTDDYRQFEINTDGLRWFNVIKSGWTAGDITVKVTLYND